MMILFKVVEDGRQEEKRKTAGTAAREEGSLNLSYFAKLLPARRSAAAAVSYFQLALLSSPLPPLDDSVVLLLQQQQHRCGSQAAATATALAGICYTRAGTTDGAGTGCRSGFAAGDR